MRTEENQLTPINAPLLNLCPLASYQQQRRSLGLLFRELAMSERRRLSLPVILEAIAASRRIRPGASSLHAVLLIGMIAAIALLLLVQWSAMIVVVVFGGAVVLFALSLPRHDDYARYVARRLAGSVSRGRTLAEAMARQPLIFTTYERRIIEVGEQSGRLAESLDALAHYNMMSERYSRIGAAILYPLIVLAICANIVTFVTIKILPKYVEVFAQLGSDLPSWTISIVSGFERAVPLAPLLGFVGPIVFISILAFIIPRFAGGSTRLTLFFILLGPLVVLLFTVLEALSMSGQFFVEQLIRNLATAGLGVAFATAVGFILYLIVLYASLIVPRVLRRLTRWALGRFRTARRLRLARFLMSLGFLLRARIPMPEALTLAAETVGGRLRREAQRMRAMIEQGHSFTEAMRTARSFEGQTAAILALSDWRGSLADDCVEIAEQLRRRAEEALDRMAALIEWPSIILVGIVLGAFTIAVYLPLFYIPSLVK